MCGKVDGALERAELEVARHQGMSYRVSEEAAVGAGRRGQRGRRRPCRQSELLFRVTEHEDQHPTGELRQLCAPGSSQLCHADFVPKTHRTLASPKLCLG